MFAILTRGSGKLWHENQWKIFSAEGPLDFDLINHSSNRLFSDEVMHMRKFDYYSADHTWGGAERASNVLRSMGKTQPAHAFLRVNSA